MVAPTKVYLAARMSRAAEMQEVKRALNFLGFDVVSTWHDTVDEIKDDVQEQDEILTLAPRGLRELSQANILIAFSEKPESPKGRARGGRHIQLGYCLGVNSALAESGTYRYEIFLVGPRENAFSYHPNINRYDTLEQLLEVLAARQSQLHMFSEV